jgi:glycosyltransferase involved in cell wall biosynthesis
VDAIHVLSKNVEAGVAGLVGSGRAVPPLRRIVHGPYSRMLEHHGQHTKAEARALLGLSPDEFVILQFGILRPYKGASRLIAAMDRLKDMAGLHAILAGGGQPSYIEELGRQAELASGPAIVEVRGGFLPDEQLGLLLTAADLSMFPYENISQSGALHLAMTFGCLCLCSDLAGFRECMPEGCDELLLDTADPEQLSSRIRALVVDPGLHARLQQRLKHYSENEFNWDVIATQVLAFYRDARSARVSGDI